MGNIRSRHHSRHPQKFSGLRLRGLRPRHGRRGHTFDRANIHHCCKPPFLHFKCMDQPCLRQNIQMDDHKRIHNSKRRLGCQSKTHSSFLTTSRQNIHKWNQSIYVQSRSELQNSSTQIRQLRPIQARFIYIKRRFSARINPRNSTIK
jgi:hypothetical protein